MTFIKVFEANTEDALTQEVNAWIDTYRFKVEIKDIKFSNSITVDKDDFTIYSFSAMVIYEAVNPVDKG